MSLNIVFNDYINIYILLMLLYINIKVIGFVVINIFLDIYIISNFLIIK